MESCWLWSTATSTSPCPSARQSVFRVPTAVCSVAAVAFTVLQPQSFIRMRADNILNCSGRE